VRSVTSLLLLVVASMGSDPEKTMTAVFEWLDANQRP